MIDIWDRLKQLLLDNISSARPASGGNEVCMVCFNDDCNDRSGHLYIGMNNGYPMFHCKKCGISGRVNMGLMNSLGIYDTDLAIELNKISKSSKYNYTTTQQQSKSGSRLYVVKNDYISNTELSEVKLAFINKRLGTNLTYSDVLQLKIVLNLYDLLNTNNITKYNRYPDIMDELDRSFIGFISRNNAKVNLRNLREGKVLKWVDKRYVNYTIFNEDETRAYYVLPTVFSLDNINRTQIHIAEGPFDILSVYLNLRNKQPGLYSAIQGNNYLSLIEYILVELKLFYSEVHIYRDLGVNYDEFIQVSQILGCFNIPVYIHTNLMEGEKDFGVSPDKIKENIIQL